MSENYFQKKLWMVSGKGGVGKTTLSAALGLLSARKGYSTLLVETHGLNHLGELLDVGSVGYEPSRVKENLWLCQLDPEAALEEYVLQQIKVKMIYNMVFKNRYVRHFLDAAPGLVELLTIGKIWALCGKAGEYGNKRSFDRVIVDAPSTGHGLSLLTVPEVVARAVRVGPLKTKSEAVLEYIRDANSSMMWLCTLAEEMPVAEAIDMTKKLKEQVKMALGPILLNSLWPDLVSKPLPEVVQKKFPFAASYEERRRLGHFYVDKIQKQLPEEKFCQLPLVYETSNPLKIAETLSQKLEEYLNAS